MRHIDPWVAEQLLAIPRARGFVRKLEGETGVTGGEWEQRRQFQSQLSHPPGTVCLEVLGGPGEAHDADFFLHLGPRTPGQTRLVGEPVATDAGVSARQADRPFTLTLQIAMDALLVFQVLEEPCPPPRRSKLRTELRPAVLVQRKGFTLRMPPFGEDVRPLPHRFEVHAERPAHRLREIDVIKREEQAKPDHFPPDEALLPALGGIQADAGEVSGHRLIPNGHGLQECPWHMRSATRAPTGATNEQAWHRPGADPHPNPLPGGEGASTAHTPRNRRLPKFSASEASKIFCAADSMSYSTRRYSTVRAPVSQMTKHARLS